jgi:hypothetical protein
MVRRLRTGAVVTTAPAQGATIPADDHARLLSPPEASAYLKDKWNLPRGPRRLGELRAEGGGPKYYRAGNEVRYAPIHLDEYAVKILGEPLSSTSEETARRRAVA